MKCPHCNKDIDSDPTSPQALLLHIKGHLKRTKDTLDDMKKLHGDGWLGQRQKEKNLARWQAWHDWVEKQIEVKP
jgi:hypothetical protein